MENKIQQENDKEKIVYTEWGLANVFKDGTIELHKDLQNPKWKKLREKILHHERDHDFNKGFIHNLYVDVFNFVGAYGLLQFMLKRPKTWIQMLPIYWTNSRGIVYDKNLMFFYTLIIGLIFILIKLGGLI